MIGFLNSIIDPLKKNRYISLSMRKLLFPLAWIYGLLLLIRHTLFDLKLLSQKRVAIKTLGVGNLALGGTGKSVVVDYLLEQFKKTTHLAVLSRGYKRKTKGYIQAQQNVTAALIGDEPFQFHKKHPEVIVAVCEKRVVGIQHLMALEKGPSVVVLDDVMQHRWLVIDKLIMTTTYDNLYSSDALFPVGALRDRKKEAQRAAILLITKCPQQMTLEQTEQIKKRIKPKQNQAVFFTSIEYASKIIGCSKTINLKELKGITILVVTGIADPKPLYTFLEETQVQFYHLAFPDHHSFSDHDVKKIENHQAELILTTEKDFGRLSPKLPNAPLFYLPIKLSFLFKKEEELFNQKIKAFLED